MGEGLPCSQRTYSYNERNGFSIQTLKKAQKTIIRKIRRLLKTKSEHILSKTHTIYIITQTPELYHFRHIIKSNLIVYAIILHMFAGNRSHQCLGSECTRLVFLLSHPIVRHHMHRICHLNGSASSPVYCKNMKILPPSDPCILTIVM